MRTHLLALCLSTPCSELPCRVFLQRMAANASLLCWEVMEGNASRMELLPHSYSSSWNTNKHRNVKVFLAKKCNFVPFCDFSIKIVIIVIIYHLKTFKPL